MFVKFCGDLDFNRRSVGDIETVISPPLTYGVSSSTWSFYDHLAIIGEVRLDNRDELLSMTEAELRPGHTGDDAVLIAAYAKWGERCPHFLQGEFAFAIWDNLQQRLFCCRDHMGFRAFLYWRNGSRFIFSNSIERILECPGVRRELNYQKFGSLAVPPAEDAVHEETFHAGIFSLPPGSWMSVASTGVRQGKYWELELRALPAVPRRPEEVFDALRELLFQSVGARIDRDFPVTALLSGGLDSSAIVSIAASILQRKNRQLTAVAAVLPEESRGQFSDERDYVEEFRAWPNIDIKYVTAAGRGPFDSLSDSSRFAPHPYRSSRIFLLEECQNAAVDSGARSLLWGGGGELGVTSWSNRYYVDLAVRLRWFTLAKELKNRRSHRNVSSIRRLAKQVLDTIFPFRGQATMLLLSRDFQRKYRPRFLRIRRSPYQQQYQAEQIHTWLRLHALERGQGIWPLPLSQPLADRRVLEFCLALPGNMNVRDGYSRYLVRGALDGILPPRIQWRTDKTPFSPDFYVRYRSQLGMAKEFVSAIGPRDPVRSVIDVPKVERLLTPVDPEAQSATAKESVVNTLYAVNFLRQFSEFNP